MKKKIIISLLSILLVLGVVGTFWGPSVAQAASSIWDSCPKGKVNDPYPGDCRDYIDTNNDGICDRSQPAPSAVSTPSPVTTAPTAATPAASALVDTSLTGSGTASAASAGTEAIGSDTAAGTVGGSIYYVLPVLAGLVVLYALTWILSARRVFKPLTHRKIWNTVLLVAALVSALLGIILALNIDHDTGITLPFNMLFWHVEAGIAMGIVAVFHILWHWRYFAKLLKLSGNV